jgi:hypothetical protein
LYASVEKGFRRDPTVGGMAVRLEVRTWIHPEGFILKDKPCRHIMLSSPIEFFNKPAWFMPEEV